MMNTTELTKLWKQEEKNAHIHGWDFSYLNGRYVSNENKLPWNYEAIVKSYLKSNTKILDIDTGGGEVLLSFNHPFGLTSVTEAYPSNVQLCKKELLPLGIDFREATDYSNLPFGDATFDIVLNRHGTYDLSEIKRILKNDGIFITQQVGEKNNHELIELLCPNCIPQFTGWNLANELNHFENAGFEVVSSDECFIESEFYDIGAVVCMQKLSNGNLLIFLSTTILNNFCMQKNCLSNKAKFAAKIIDL